MRFILVKCALLFFCSGYLQAASQPDRPNLIFILTDDLRYDALSMYNTFPWLETPNLDALAAEGVVFENAFVTTSLCSPSRASFLTGTYANRHGVVVNSYVDPAPDLQLYPKLLQAAGYETAYIGKWHMDPDDNPRDGFDYWVSFSGQGKYFNTKLNINGVSEVSHNYITDELTDRALQFLDYEREKPFALYLSHKAIHDPFKPAPRHENLYADAELLSFDDPADEIATKPKWVRALANENRGWKSKAPIANPHQMMNMLRAISAVDESVGTIVAHLRASGILDNTAIIFAGDNGYLYGEHGGLGEKRNAYEPSMRVPILMRYPPLGKAGTRVAGMVLNIDLAPTMLDLAGVAVPDTMQGRSWLGLLRDDDPGREHFFYEYYKETLYRPTGGYPQTPTILAVRTREWKYITYPDLEGEVDELYHLSEDPGELKNLASELEYAEKLTEMKALLEAEMEAIDYQSPKPVNRIANATIKDERNVGVLLSTASIGVVLAYLFYIWIVRHRRSK